MHIALFGGTFDPPHLGHQSIARYLLAEKLVDQVWFVPVYQHPWANQLHKTQLTSYAHRLEMISLMAENHIKIAEFKDISFTLSTIEYFEKTYPKNQFSWVMGSEYLPKFHLFLKTHPMLINKPIFIYPRQDHPLEPLTPNMKALSQAPLVTISSTQIRQKASKNESIQHLVTFPVNTYILTHNLYL